MLFMAEMRAAMKSRGTVLSPRELVTEIAGKWQVLVPLVILPVPPLVLQFCGIDECTQGILEICTQQVIEVVFFILPEVYRSKGIFFSQLFCCLVG